jgi:hypothetical protein
MVLLQGSNIKKNNLLYVDQTVIGNILIYFYMFNKLFFKEKQENKFFNKAKGFSRIQLSIFLNTSVIALIMSWQNKVGRIM